MLNRRSLIRAGSAAATAGLLAGGVAGGPSPAVARPKWGRLRAALSGPLVLPGDADYERAKAMVLGQFDSVHPQAVAYCRTPRDVSVCLRFAQDHELPVAPRSGGHNYAGWSTTPGLIVDLSMMNGARPSGRTVRLGPGAQSVDAIAKLAPYDLQVLSGLCPTVCPGGYISGGGIGWGTRKYGLASDHLRSAQVVLADGRVVRADEENEPDLFWALRGGGGGNFGIVTEFEVAPVAIPSLINFTLTWPWEAAVDVIRGYTEWLPGGPDAWGSSLVAFMAESAPGAVPVLLIQGAYLGSEPEYHAARESLVSAIGRPAATEDTAELPFDQAAMQYYGCGDFSVEECHLVGNNPEAKLPRYHFAVDRGRLADHPLTAAAVRELLEAFEADRAAEQFRYLTFFALGGQANRVPADATAYVHRTSHYYIGYTVGLQVDEPEAGSRAAAQSWADKGFEVSDRYGIPENYVNFPDPHLADWRTAYYGANYSRLVRVKRDYDRYGFFSFGQSVGG